MSDQSEKRRKKRVLGVDPGGSRTGLAVSDPLGITAQGLETLVEKNQQKIIDHISKLIDSYDVETVVIGMPLSMGGREIEPSRRSRLLKKGLEEKRDVRVVLSDERMTSLESERVLKKAGRIKKKENVDKLAAVLILQGFLDGEEQ
ncbi:MAG: Holliday junction resolvase RuvX [Candidatus Krumholzibacteriota bacterium]